jgi:polar amino acid transport system substrate-binding protein
MTKHKSIIQLLLISMSLLIFTGCQSDHSVMTKRIPLKVGMELNHSPFETKNSTNQPDGISVMIANELAKSLGTNIEIVDLSYENLISSLETGKIDLIISSMSITDERLEQIDFSAPYTSNPLSMLVYQDSKVKTPADLNDPSVIIVSKTGAVGAIWAAKNAPQAQIRNIDDSDSAILEVAEGNADVFIYDTLTLIRQHEIYPDTTRLIFEQLQNTQGWAIGVKKGNHVLLDQTNHFIQNAKTNGTFDRIRDNYLIDAVETFKKYNLKFFF